MVAVAIGGFLMIGAMTVFMQSRTTYRSTEGLSRLEENARFALAAIEPDIRLASYYGLTTRGTRINGRAKTTEPNSGLAPASCGPNWPIDLENPVAATNGAWAWGGCANATDGGHLAGTDTIVIRRVSEDPVTPPLAGGIYVQSARFQPGQVFTGGTVPAGYLPATSQTFQLMTTGYYIAQRSSNSLNVKGDTIPSLHRIRVISATTIQDDELLAGVEDLQIELGLDTDAVGAPNRGSIDRYVSADDPILDPTNGAYNPNAVILSVRIWLRLRAEDFENGFSDATTYSYADVSYMPAGAERSFRRLLVSKTIYLRNMRQMS
jgi:type IV pilus assembly protein PilW